MTPTLQLRLADAAALRRHHDPARIQGYCRTCPSYGRVWSCPPFEGPVVGDFAWVALATQQVWTGPGVDQAGMIEAFHADRRAFCDLMTQAESRVPGATALVAGHCHGCAACARPEGLPCHVPAVMRHSLEAAGFDVTALVEDLAGVPVLWPREGLPAYLVTAGALLCADRAEAEAALRAVEELWEGLHG